MSGEKYVDKSNLEEKTREWMEQLPYNKTWNCSVEMDKSALIVVDMQEFFLNPSSHAYIPAGEVIIDNINEMVDYFAESCGMVLYTRHVTCEGQEGNMGQWWIDVLYEGEDAQIDERIDIRGDTITKKTYSAFLDTNIEGRLNGIENIFISGMMTDICCNYLARDAFVRGYRVFFLADATAAVNEDLHLSSLKSLSYGVAEILSCQRAKSRCR
ncbi:MAG: isochorismatase family cysteine hydrolase [Thermoplasmata archaeon]